MADVGLHDFLGLVRCAGMRPAAGLVIRRALRRRNAERVHIGELGDWVLVRPCDSDVFVLSQIFGWHDYRIPAHASRALRLLSAEWLSEGMTPVIVDGGANVGYSARYFAMEYPEARVIAVEPDPNSFSVLVETSKGCPRITPVHGALWSADGEARLSTREGWSWAGIVNDEAGAAVPAFRIEALLARCPKARLLILKLDVEGAEKEICAASTDILRGVPCIVLEPHDWLFPGRACMAPLFAALAQMVFDTLVVGEIVVFLSPDLTRGPGSAGR